MELVKSFRPVTTWHSLLTSPDTARAKMLACATLQVVASPPAIFYGEWITGLGSTEELVRALTWGPFVWLCLLSVTGLAILSWLYCRISRKPSGRRVAALLAFWLVWGLATNLGYALLLHAFSSYPSDTAALIMVGMYAGAMGLFFSVLGVLTVVGELEQMVPFENGEGKRQLAGRLNVKLSLSISVSIFTFLIGSIGVTLMPIHAGFSLIDALVRCLLVAIPFLLLTVLLVWILSRLLTVPLVKAGPRFAALARDELTARFEEPGRDELGMVFHDLNRFLGRLRTTVGDARSQILRNEERSRDLDGLVERQNGLLTQISNQVAALGLHLAQLDTKAASTVDRSRSMGETVGELHEGLDNQTASVSEVSSASEELLAEAQTIAQVAQSRLQAAASLKALSATSRSDLGASLEAMDTVLGQMESLTKLNKMIATMASQTNVLAMNAAIEAAHAGEAGRGFSVVAQEIRSLAESSQANAKSASSFLKGIAARIRESHASLKVVDASFLQVQSVTQVVVEGLDEIGGASKEIGEASQSIVVKMSRLQRFNQLVNRVAEILRQGLCQLEDAAIASRGEVVGAGNEVVALERIAIELASLTAETGNRSANLKSDSQTLAEQFDRFVLQ